jgi:hypothetical protein
MSTGNYPGNTILGLIPEYNKLNENKKQKKKVAAPSPLTFLLLDT